MGDGGTITLNRTVIDSSSRVKLTGAVGGVAFQPCGNSSCTSALAAPGEWLITVTRRSRSVPRAVAGVAPSGTTAMSGERVTANFGTTCTSLRFSPLKMLPSDRNCTGSVVATSTPATFSTNVAVNGVGRNGRPGATSLSTMKRAASVAYLKCAAVSRAVAGIRAWIVQAV